MYRIHHTAHFIVQVLCLVLVRITARSTTDNTCYVNNPPDLKSCDYSCIKSISEEYFLSLPAVMKNCKSVSYYLSNGKYSGFTPGYFSNIGHVDHFFMEITNVIFEYFPGNPESGSPFENTSFDFSATVQLVNVQATSGWNWKAFDNMAAGQGGSGSIQVYKSGISHLGRDFRNVFGGSLQRIRFSGGDLRTLEDGVFDNFVDLKTVYLHNNLLTEMKRSYFPNPAKALKELILQNNRLETLPLDMFINMPNLELVSLTGNSLTTIDERIFKPLAGKIFFDFASSTLHCDCHLSWLKHINGPYADSFLSSKICRTPPALKGLSLQNVNKQELVCN